MATGQGFLVLVGAPPCIGEKLPPWDGDRDQSLSGDGDRDRGQFSPNPRPRFKRYFCPHPHFLMISSLG